MNKKTKRTVLWGGRLLRRDAIEDKKVVIIRGKNIAEIVDQNVYKAHPEDRRINLKGKFISPGFIDVHIHGAGGVNALDGQVESLERISRTLVKYGVTGYVAAVHYYTNGSNAHLATIRENTGRNFGGAKLLGAHLEGPFINNGKRGMIQRKNIFTPTAGRIQKIHDLIGNGLKIMTVAPELKNAHRVIKYFSKKGVVVSLGHSNATMEEALAAFRAGVNHVTHMFNTMRPFSHRDPGVLGALVNEKDVYVELIADGHHVQREVVQILSRIIDPSKICLISDSINAGAEDGCEHIYNKFSYRTHQGTARHKTGKLVGTTLALNQLADRMRRFTGLKLPVIIRMCTANPAKSVKLDRRLGTAEKGRAADLAIIDDQFKVYLTFVDGEIVYRRRGFSVS